MKNKSRSILFLSLLFLNLLIPSTAFSGLFYPKTFKLKNGLEVIVITNKRVPVVKQVVLYKVGAMDEHWGKSGLAHFLEHLMFKGTSKVTGQEFTNTITRYGGELNASTSEDSTMYYEVIDKAHLETIIRLESDRMANLKLSEKDVETERPVIIEERKMRVDNVPLAILQEAADASFYQNHPYRIPTIGWENEMERLSHADAVNFYRSWYAPNNAVLVFAGDVTVEEVKPLVEKYYGVIPPKKLAERRHIKEPVKRGVSSRLEKKSNRVKNPVYIRFYWAPNLKSNKKKTYALAVLDKILSDGADSILYNNLITKDNIAVSVSTYLGHDYGRGPGSFAITGQPVPGKSLKEFEEALLKELKEVADNGVSKEEVEKAKNRMLAEIAYIRDNSVGGADLFAFLIGNGFQTNDVEDWPERIKAVTHEEVNQVAKEVLSQDDSLTALLLPENKNGN